MITQERTIQEAIASLIRNSPDWPATARVVVSRPGNIIAEVDTALGKSSLCVVVEEPDHIESLYGAATFAVSSSWTVSVFTQEVPNKTGLDNLAAAMLVRRLLADQDLGGLLAEPFNRCRVSYVGKKGEIVAREVTFTAAYQG